MSEDILKVLLIEDDEDDFVLTSDLLDDVKGTKYEIVWKAKYPEAIKAMLEDKFDVCLVDYRLGEYTGIELLREAVKNGCRTPVILLTGQGDQEVDNEATAAGAADYLIKGEIESQLLERTIRYAVAHGKMLESMRESENRFRSVVESANDAIILADSAGKIISWNNSAKNIFGYTESEILGNSFSTLFPPRYCKVTMDDETDPLLASGLLHSGSKAVELNGLNKDGREFPLEISLSSWESAESVFYSGIIRDITQRKSLEDQLTHQALHDPLTKLANRVLFRNRVEHALQRVKRHHKPIAVLFLDLDNFKTVNDTLGHTVGDELLIAVAERLDACLRTSDTAARLGGDEFAVLIEDTTHTGGAIPVAERINEVIKLPFNINGKEVFIGTSIGIALSENGNETPNELLRNADVAMYTAKNQGKGGYSVFEAEMHEAIINRVKLEDELRRGIEQSQFELNYQPIVDLKQERLIGMEALVRWNHPTRGVIAPLDFIPVAEETRLIIPLGAWILKEACGQAKNWQNLYGSKFSITVNISSYQFQHDSLIRSVSSALEESGLSPNCLILEITENLMVENSEGTVGKLRELKKLGVRLAIDDFGTGYSSLSYLQRFPIDILKIDKSFVDKIINSREGEAVTRAIITMGNTLHLRTIAEGIETSEQSDVLQTLGCELGQGFHFAKPLNGKDMNNFLRQTKFSSASCRINDEVLQEKA